MNTSEVAHRLVELVRSNQISQAYAELYSPEIESLEPQHTAHPQVKGMEAVKQKAAHFQSGIEEVYGVTVSDPIVANNYFSCYLNMDLKMKGMERMNMDEVCVYKVENGKIVFEQFFF